MDEPLNSLSCPILAIASVKTTSGDCFVYSENATTALDQSLQSGCSFVVMPPIGKSSCEATNYNHVSVPLTNVDSKKYLYFVS